ncbi:(2Fe-2S)-binding protein [Streptomyces sp. NPDC053431]|uniref:(2Fe-2S)-binding protein n=1 Tax=Streptomyces sp. NPDC053431 TaxID=3365703 RepID=UPI0037D67E6F
MKVEVAFVLNGEPVRLVVEPRELLGHILRERLGCRGVHVACGQGNCGACTVLVDNQAVRSCLLLAVQSRGRDIRTVANLTSDDCQLHPLQAALKKAGGVQCGYCTAGIILSVLSFLDENPSPTPAAIREALSGHICRCTGYTGIIEAVEQYAQNTARADRAGSEEKGGDERHEGQ